MERPEEEASPSAAESGSPDPHAVTEALSECVIETLQKEGKAEVPGLGTFRIEHIDSQMQEQSDGSLSMTPPRDAITFEPVAS